MVNLQDFPLVAFIPFPSKINPNPDLPAAFIPFFRRIFLMANAMKIHLKKNAAANGLELKERLQGLTATDVTHSPQITKHSLPINSQNKTGISAPSDLHSQVASLCFYSYIQFFFLFFLCSRSFLSFVSFHSFFLLFTRSFLSFV